MEKRYAAFGLRVGASFPALVAGFRELGCNVEGATRIERVTSERVGEEIHVAVYYDRVDDGTGLPEPEPKGRLLLAPQWPDDSPAAQ